jgi:hypothetical protein
VECKLYLQLRQHRPFQRQASGAPLALVSVSRVVAVRAAVLRAHSQMEHRLVLGPVSAAV